MNREEEIKYLETLQADHSRWFTQEEFDRLQELAASQRSVEAAQRQENVLENINNTITDLVGSFLYYDRKEDEDLPRGAIEHQIDSGTLTEEQIVQQFAAELKKGIEK